ncbi:MAG TPA: gamma-glutamyl-gamma-aminobutyrate hydrolase family protein [Planktothrix sp.]
MNHAELRKPVIGINVDITGEKTKEMQVGERYVQAIERAGGIPVFLPPVPAPDLPAILKRVDGIMCIGGLDYNPQMYGQKPEPSVDLIDEQRNDYDYSLARTVINKTNLPFLGICAGSQILNIGLGGTLIQDIPTDHKSETVVKHRGEGFTTHMVNLENGSKLFKIYGKTQLNVPTSHHQAVDKLGTGLKVAAHADDGITEAVELPGDRFVIGVQWHPERDFDNNAALFNEFIAQARKQETSVAAGSNVVKVEQSVR